MNYGQFLFTSKNRTKGVSGKDNCMGKTKSKIKKKKRRLEQKAIQNGTANAKYMNKKKKNIKKDSQ